MLYFLLRFSYSFSATKQSVCLQSDGSDADKNFLIWTVQASTWWGFKLGLN